MYVKDFKMHENYQLGSLQSKRLKQFFRIEDCETFVETGTYKGDGVQWGVDNPNFQEIYSVELSESLFRGNMQRFNGNGRITLAFGDTVIFLKELLPLLKNKTLLYLDAHISDDTSTHNPAYPVPLIEETEIVTSSFYDFDNLIVVVDDERLWTEQMKKTLVESYSKKGLSSFYVDDAIVFCKESWLRS